MVLKGMRRVSVKGLKKRTAVQEGTLGEQRWCPSRRVVVQDIVAVAVPVPVVESAHNFSAGLESPAGPLGTGRDLECPKGDASPDSWTDGGFWGGEA